MQDYYNLSLIRNVHPSQLNGSYSLTVNTEHDSKKVHIMNKVILSFQDVDGKWKQIDSKLYHWDWMKYGAVPDTAASYRLVLNTRLHKSEHAGLTGFEHLRLRKPVNVGVYQEYGWVKPVESYDYSTYVMDAAETLNPIWLEYKTNTAAKYQPVRLEETEEDKNIIYKRDNTNDVATLTVEIDLKRVSEVINLLRANGFAKNLKVNLPQ